MTEFNLSSKITYGNDIEMTWFSLNDVKEFIRLLKEYFDEDFERGFIDKLAGDALI